MIGRTHGVHAEPTTFGLVMLLFYAEVMRDLYRLKQVKSLSFGERKMLETARALIVKEIAIARRKTEDKVREDIEKIFEQN